MKAARWWRAFWLKRRADLACLAVILIFFVAFFNWALLRGKFFIAADAFVYSYPLRTLAWSAVRHGHLPLWTPHVFSGYPLLSMAQVAFGYPLTWSYLFLPGRWAEQIYVYAPFLLAPAFTYAYAREIGRSRIASLLAGLSFAYGGSMINPTGAMGFFPNSFMWLPLLLIAIERARTGAFVRCARRATIVYAASILGGYGLAFLLVGLLALLYATTLSAACATSREREHDAAHARFGVRFDRRCWRPAAVASAAVAAGAGLTAWQILETMRAARRSIRGALPYELFVEGSLSPLFAFKSFVAPRLHIGDVSTYVAPLVVALALFACVSAARRRARDFRIWFWLVTAVVAMLLTLGGYTPLYRLLYHLPLFNLFRVPARHTFELTFASSVLAAYGWDALTKRLWREHQQTTTTTNRQRAALGVCLTLLSLLCGVGWWLASSNAQSYGDFASRLPMTTYLLWKCAFTALTAATAWCGWRAGGKFWRVGLSTCALTLICFCEPYITTADVWSKFAKPAERFTQAAPATRALAAFPPEENRVYTRVALFSEERTEQPRLDPPNLTAVFGLQNVAGYEPLISERYSRALGNVWLDAVSPRPLYTLDRTLFSRDSHVLDLLNTTFVVSYAGLRTSPLETITKDGIEFAQSNLEMHLAPGESATLNVAAQTADTLAIVTTLGGSVEVPQGATVARVELFVEDGRRVERELRAGVDTAEWAHEHDDVRRHVAHALAPVFSGYPGVEQEADKSFLYWTRLPLGERLHVSRIRVTNTAPSASFSVWKATLYNSASDGSSPLTRDDPAAPSEQLDETRWQRVYHQDGVQILRNARALPRVWIVKEAEAVDGEEALRRIRGVGARDFDPHRTALVEDAPAELPPLPGGEVSDEERARIVSYEPTRLVIDAATKTNALLVVSEMFYPGWEARVDGVPAQIHLTDYLLRGVALPAGAHRVEMRYTAPAFRNGLVISAATLLLIIVVGVWDRKRRQDVSRAPSQ